MLEKPEIWGIESISAEAIVIRLVVKTRSAAKDDVARELRSRLKRALDDMDVKMPALNSITLSGFEGATSVKGARPPRTKPVEVQPAAKKPPRAKRGAVVPPVDPRGYTAAKPTTEKPAAPRQTTPRPAAQKPTTDPTEPQGTDE